MEKRFSVRFEYGDEVNLAFELQETDAVKFGNETQVRVSGDGWPQTIDTRYDTSLARDGSNFTGWCRRYIERNYDGITSIKEDCDG